MAREMLKLRKGDSAIMVKADGSIELAGVNDKPLVNDRGEMSPIILFASAWVKKDPNVMNVLVENFKQTVRDGHFGFDAKRDLMFQEKMAASAAMTMQSASGAVTKPVDVSNPADMAKILNDAGLDGNATKEQINVAVEDAKKKVSRTPVLEPTHTPEEYAKLKKEEENLQNLARIARNRTPAEIAQMETMRKGAKIISQKPFEQHKEPDLPVEQTMAYQKASPEEQVLMKKKQTQVDGYNPSNEDVVEAKTIGNVTIEEEISNENK